VRVCACVEPVPTPSPLRVCLSVRLLFSPPSVVLLLLVEAAADAAEGADVALLVPLVHPRRRADGGGELPHGFALALSALLLAQHPLVVPVPAVQRLVLAGEALVAGGGPDHPDLVQLRLLLLRQRRGRGGENLTRG
jgi:hypothetical protein